MKRLLALVTLLVCLFAFGALAEEPAATDAPVSAVETAAPSEEASPAGESTAAPAEESYTLLKYGANGDDVTRLQNRLFELGYLTATPNGHFGEGTRKAVKLFQKTTGLTVDGLAGKATQTLLFSDEAPVAPEPAGPVNVLEGTLPMLVNADHTIDEDFVPADLVLLKDVCSIKGVTIKYSSIQAVQTAAEALKAMLTAATGEGLTKWQVSAGYRSYDQQQSILNNKINSYLKKNKTWSRAKARKAALKSVAEPGASEHHLGLAFDVNVLNTTSFISTKQCTWLHEHCWEYGFIVRYAKDKESITGITSEPWHIRYVGVEHAMAMKESGQCLEEYLEGLE